jgi:hypothetical protein
MKQLGTFGTLLSPKSAKKHTKKRLLEGIFAF